MKIQPKILIVTFLTAFCVSNLNAENARLRLQVVPSIYEAEIIPGEYLSFNIMLKNAGNKEIIVSGNVFSLHMAEDGSPIIIDDPYFSHSCQSWIQFNPNSLFIKPGEKRDVNVSIKSSKSASGGNYGVILFEFAEKVGDKKAGISLALRTGTTVILTVKNSKKIDAKLESFNALNMDNKIIFEIKFRNNSNVHVKPSGSIVIFEDEKKVLDRINIGNNNFVLPNSTRIFKLVWDNEKRKVKQNVSLLTAECKMYVKGLSKILNEKVEFIKFR